MITADIQLREIQALLDNALKNAKDLKPAMDDVGELIVNSIKLSFDVGGRFSTPENILGGSRKWKTSFRASHEGGQTLRDTSRLHNSISYNSDSHGVDITSGAKYSAQNHFGGIIKAKNAPFLHFKLSNGNFVRVKSVITPARPFMNIQSEDLPEILQIIENHLIA